MNDFPFDHDSGKAMGRHQSNAKAEAGIEHRKLREEIEALKHDNGRLLDSLNEAESEIERLWARVADLRLSLTNIYVELDRHEIRTPICDTSLRWYGRQAKETLNATPERQS